MVLRSILLLAYFPRGLFPKRSSHEEPSCSDIARESVYSVLGAGATAKGSSPESRAAEVRTPIRDRLRHLGHSRRFAVWVQEGRAGVAHDVGAVLSGGASQGNADVGHRAGTR